MKPDDDRMVLSERGLVCLMRRIETGAINAREIEERLAETRRELDGTRRDYSRLERDRDDEVRAYHKALDAALAALKKRGVKKLTTQMPPGWERNAKQIAEYDDIPF